MPKLFKTGKSTCISAIILILLTFTSCTHDPGNIGDLETICYDTQVLPILQTSCGMTGCHSGTDPEEGFDVSNYLTIMKAVSPGDPRGSALYSVLTDINGEHMMPPDRPLTLEQRTIIHLWIAQGANETKCNTDTSGNGNTDDICFVQDILPMMLSSCGTTGCHDAITHEEGYVLTDYNSIIREGIKPFNPNDSKILEVVIESGEDRMPPSPRAPLTSAQVAALRQWITDGAKNSDCPENTCDTTGTISFAGQVNPLLQANCVGCHNSTLASGGVNLSSHAQVAVYVETLRNGTPILSGTIKKLAGFQAMPPTFALSDCNIGIIEKWIRQGAANN